MFTAPKLNGNMVPQIDICEFEDYFDMGKFLGRKQELDELHRYYERSIASLLIIKGRRRVGKTRLLEEFGKSFKHYFYFIGMPPTHKTTAPEQIDDFTRQMCKIFNLPKAQYDDWANIFWALDEKLPTNEKILLIFDEISWMGSKDHNFLGKLKSAWDSRFKKHDNLIFIICGSASSWIDQNILSNTGFVGRVSYSLTLEELPLEVCKDFWGKNISKYEMLRVLSVTGGIPKYLEEIDPHLTAEQNIKKLCFTKGGLLVNEFEHIFSSLFLHNSEFYRKLIRTLVNGSVNRDELIKTIGVRHGGKISNYLEELEVSGFIKRDYTWNIATTLDSKLSMFRLSDNYIRFYLKYIEKNITKIENNAFSFQSLTNFTNWPTIIGLQFENLVLNNRKIIHEALQLTIDEIICANPYFQNTTTRTHGCQIDYMIQTRFSNLYICEIKFSSSQIGVGIIQEVQDKIDKLHTPKGFSYRPVLIHANGVQQEVYDSNYFAKIIDFTEFL